MRSTRDVIIRTEDFAAAVRFYEHVLGFAVTLRQDHLVGFDTGAIQLFVERGAPPHPPVFELRVADVAAERDRLVAAGCTLVEENPALPRCYVRDPYGFVINLDRG
jgi:catechol 2,3-dioxygenase-like lactoylglutathione lyase family enzyme